MKGVHCQTSTIIIVTFAKCSLVNQGGATPNILRTSLTGPKDSWKKVLQITVMITGVVIIGIKNKTLKNLLKTISLQTIKAKEKPIIYWRETVVIDRKLNLKKDSQNLLSSVNNLI